MNICFGQSQIPFFPQGTAVTIGNFDGVHLGHQHILKRLKNEADSRGLPTVAMIFEPQPQEFFARKFKSAPPYRLTPLRTKLQLLKQTSCLDAVWVLRFNQAFANITAEKFIEQLLIKDLNTKYLLIGDDFRFGAGRQGHFEMLQQYQNIVVEKTPSILVENIRASSTAVRNALCEGDLTYARKLLGHDYVLSGHVKHGAKLGRTIGCPTANVQLPQHHYALSGVFVVDVMGGFGKKRGVASFGMNPTVSQSKRQKLEVHLFDFNGDLYGQRISVEFLHKLRDEEKFDNIDALKNKIWQDMALAQNWVAE